MALDKVHTARNMAESAQQRFQWTAVAAVRAGEDKTAVALAAGISRPTLDAWIERSKLTLDTSGSIRYGTTHVGWLTSGSPRILTTAPYQDDHNRFGHAVATDWPHTPIHYSVATVDGKMQLAIALDALLGLS